MKDFTIELSPDELPLEISYSTSEDDLKWVAWLVAGTLIDPLQVTVSRVEQVRFGSVATWSVVYPDGDLEYSYVEVELPMGAGAPALAELIIRAFQEHHPGRAISSS